MTGLKEKRAARSDISRRVNASDRQDLGERGLVNQFDDKREDLEIMLSLPPPRT